MQIVNNRILTLSLFFFRECEPELLVNRVHHSEFTNLRAIFDICDLNSVSKQSHQLAS